RENESPYVKLARDTIEHYVRTGLEPEKVRNGGERKGTFVSIKKNGRLRGCIGTTGPTEDCVENEIIDNAIKAATKDPRFPPITEEELPDLVISVDVLFPPEKIDSRDMLDVREYGVIVSKGFRKGLLLPNLEGIDTVDEQINIALQKGGISPDENFKMERFRVVRYK
ncbi:MAG: AmmeMemoRadiSam system protein A, partial [Clostridia bacterium]|nr:AmmeMemoRadiSam system protein A [Clostridia bacterium]